MAQCLHVPETIEENKINEGAERILKEIRPNWKPDKIQYKLLTDGITNKLVACSLEDGSSNDTVLIRIYGRKTDLLIDRHAEKRNIVRLNEVGLAPDLYASFDNGLAYEFVPGCTLSSETVVIPNIYHLVAKKMAKMHKVPTFEQTPVLWKKLQQFLDLVPEKFSDLEKQQRYEENGLTKSQIANEISYLREKLQILKSRTVFAHNDLLLGNVIYTKEANRVTFIDFEYAAANYQAYDIGNHFSEFVGLTDVDYSKYPTKSLQFDWLRTYLTEYNKSESNPDPKVTDQDVYELYVQVNQFALASHLFWGVWSLIQAEHSYIDFDYIGYANIRFKEYFARKDEFLAMPQSPR